MAVHACPPDGSGLTPCCARTPFELAEDDRISSEAPVTCPGPAAVSRPGKEAFTPPVHYERDDGVECCVHAVPVGPDSCTHCRELAAEEPTP
ncbi:MULTISPECIES: hypothetical protein [Streptomyces]|uniref:Uncharacterized protein n=1 Tax=Streptomyces dengpaensis TaxID=2049881 RepID=A0ABM6SZ27_9ACTN|nr:MULTISPECIES: hypothetical protein [Streptomyces]AVH59947.1 hypothetical protein C4B68_33900 [Streptomyces dengpaensis]PIB09582.1 hypothetical protein B1C81_10575 [Streptomyces sp. HG99]